MKNASTPKTILAHISLFTFLVSFVIGPVHPAFADPAAYQIPDAEKPIQQERPADSQPVKPKTPDPLFVIQSDSIQWMQETASPLSSTAPLSEEKSPVKIEYRPDTNLTRDSKGRVIRYVASDGNVQEFSYDSQGRVAEIFRLSADGKKLATDKLDWDQKTAVQTDHVTGDVTHYENLWSQGGSSTTAMRLKPGHDQLGNWSGNGYWGMWREYRGLPVRVEKQVTLTDKDEQDTLEAERAKFLALVDQTIESAKAREKALAVEFARLEEAFKKAKVAFMSDVESQKNALSEIRSKLEERLPKITDVGLQKAIAAFLKETGVYLGEDLSNEITSYLSALEGQMAGPVQMRLQVMRQYLEELAQHRQRAVDAKTLEELKALEGEMPELRFYGYDPWTSPDPRTALKKQIEEGKELLKNSEVQPPVTHPTVKKALAAHHGVGEEDITLYEQHTICTDPLPGGGTSPGCWDTAFYSIAHQDGRHYQVASKIYRPTEDKGWVVDASSIKTATPEQAFHAEVYNELSHLLMRPNLLYRDIAVKITKRDIITIAESEVYDLSVEVTQCFGPPGSMAPCKLTQMKGEGIRNLIGAEWHYTVNNLSSVTAELPIFVGALNVYPAEMFGGEAKVIFRKTIGATGPCDHGETMQQYCASATAENIFDDSYAKFITQTGYDPTENERSRLLFEENHPGYAEPPPMEQVVNEAEKGMLIRQGLANPGDSVQKRLYDNGRGWFYVFYYVSKDKPGDDPKPGPTPSLDEEVLNKHKQQTGDRHRGRDSGGITVSATLETGAVDQPGTGSNDAVSSAQPVNLSYEIKPQGIADKRETKSSATLVRLTVDKKPVDKVKAEEPNRQPMQGRHFLASLAFDTSSTGASFSRSSSLPKSKRRRNRNPSLPESDPSSNSK